MLRVVVLCLLVAVGATACNCGKPPLTQTQASVTLSPEVLDFGVVPEGTSKSARVRVENAGKAPVGVLATLSTDSSADFLVPAPSATVEPGGTVELLVVFTPSGAGEDTGQLELSVKDKPDEPAQHVALRGGPLAPALTFAPDPLDFRPTTSAVATKVAQLRSSGSSALTISAVGLSSSGNPDFALVPPALPARLLPGESLPVHVEYARSARSTEGALEVVSDDPDAGLRTLRLLPDPPAVCSDFADNDGDGLTDFPSDPGCDDAQDSDEYNPVQCTTGASQSCTSDGGCAGTRRCASGAWGPCTCGDAGCAPDGFFRVDGGALVYTCCSGLVSINVSAFQVASSGRTVTPGPSQPGGPLSSTLATTCPGGALDVSRVDPGGCTETYRLQATFTGADTITGTYTAVFTGADCASALPFPLGCGSTPCVDQSWPVSATR